MKVNFEKIYGYALLGILSLPIFCSALIAPAAFAPYRVPLYLTSFIPAVFMLIRGKLLDFLPVPGVLILLLLLWLVGGTVANAFQQEMLPVNIRQFLVYSSLFMCIYVGALYYKIHHVILNRDAMFGLAVLYSGLFAYGIYTYFAQKYGWSEPLFFLRPQPVPILDGENFTQGYFGWASSHRAYSVWYEPSYASLALAVSLPLILVVRSQTWKYGLLVLAGVFSCLTFARSAWGIYVLFLCVATLPSKFIWARASPLLLILGLAIIQVSAVGLYGLLLMKDKVLALEGYGLVGMSIVISLVLLLGGVRLLIRWLRSLSNETAIYLISLCLFLLAVILLSMQPDSSTMQPDSSAMQPDSSAMQFARPLSDVSAKFRYFTSVQGLKEAIPHWLIGTGSQILHEPVVLEGVREYQMHNSVMMLFHWLGIVGLVIFYFPFWALLKISSELQDDHKRRALVVFVGLSAMALTLGGGLISLAIYWFSVGFYLAYAKTTLESKGELC